MSNLLIMPKQTGDPLSFFASLRLYYESYKRGESWYSNVLFKEQIQILVPSLSQGARDDAYLVKQSELTRYFGFVFYDYSHRPSQARITNTGIEMYEAFLEHNIYRQWDIIMSAIINHTFGRNNTAIKTSDSDLDPPKLYIRANLDMQGFSGSDFKYLLYLINDQELSYADACQQLQKARRSELEIEIPVVNSNKYSDIKFDGFLRSIGFLESHDGKLFLNDYITKKYSTSIKSLSIYNQVPEFFHTLNPYVGEASENESVYVLSPEGIEEELVSSTFVPLPYSLDSDLFNNRNNREPELANSAPGSTKYKTDTRIAKTAVQKAGYHCEIDKAHTSFESKSGDTYMESHHLVPMSAQKDCSINLDRIENIISLCATCHRAIHYGSKDTRYELLKSLYGQRKAQLKEKGIVITFEDLFGKYYK